MHMDVYLVVVQVQLAFASWDQATVAIHTSSPLHWEPRLASGKLADLLCTTRRQRPLRLLEAVGTMVGYYICIANVIAHVVI